MLIAVEGCSHGRLELVYKCVLASKKPVELVICCGDFQSVRNSADLTCLAAPAKHQKAGDFHRYFSGEWKAPILTIFIGGNHEASNYLQELPYGGWVAPNIYYLGNAGVITIGGIRIGGISGIYKGHHYTRGHFEWPPYTEDTKRSVYHTRNLEVFRLSQLSGQINIFLSHDWPRGIANNGNMSELFRQKPFLKSDIQDGRLGSAPCETLLHLLCPNYWFSGHLHAFYPAILRHKDVNKETRFLALDKVLPNRKFLQILEIPHDEKEPIELKYDLEWLTILRLTNHLLNVHETQTQMPGERGTEIKSFTPSEEDKKKTLEIFGNNLTIPLNFEKTACSFSNERSLLDKRDCRPVLNPQNSLICDLLQIDDPVTLILLKHGIILGRPRIDPSESINIEDEEFENMSSNDVLQSTSASSIVSPIRSTVSEPTQETPVTPILQSLSAPSKVSPLCLPSPRLSLPEASQDDSLTTMPPTPKFSSTSSEMSPLRLTNVCLSTPEASQENSLTSAIDTPPLQQSLSNKSVDEMSVGTPTSTKRTFKRRNENLYTNESNDES